jgi:hypothetical protein
MLTGALVLMAGCSDVAPTEPNAALENAYVPQTSSVAGCPDAVNVKGTISVQLTGPAAGVGTSTGDLAGVVSVALTGGTPTGAATHLTMSHAFTTTNGSTLSTNDLALVAPISPPLFAVSVRYDIVGGSGDFEGATGFIRTHGTVNLGTGVIDLQYVGRVCAA